MAEQLAGPDPKWPFRGETGPFRVGNHFTRSRASHIIQLCGQYGLFMLKIAFYHDFIMKNKTWPRMRDSDWLIDRPRF